ncbi:MAG: hypothetical protein LBV19_01650, partial [Streptococcaceae bacterium]|nr:hypothetical protein [Streptococcaceae bacterium]
LSAKALRVCLLASGLLNSVDCQNVTACLHTYCNALFTFCQVVITKKLSHINREIRFVQKLVSTEFGAPGGMKLEKS